MWVRFVTDFTWKPKAQVTIDYRAGTTRNIPTPAGKAAIDAGRAVAAKAPKPTGKEKSSGAPSVESDTQGA